MCLRQGRRVFAGLAGRKRSAYLMGYCASLPRELSGLAPIANCSLEAPRRRDFVASTGRSCWVCGLSLFRAQRSGIDPLRTYTDCLCSVSEFFTPTSAQGRCEGQLPTHSGRSRLFREVYGFRYARLIRVARLDRRSPFPHESGLAILTGGSVPTPVSRRWVLAPPISLAAMPRMPLSRGRNEMQTGHSEPGSRCGRSQLLACSCRPARLIPQSLSRRWPVGVPARDRDILAVFDSSIKHARTMITPPTTSGSFD